MSGALATQAQLALNRFYVRIQTCIWNLTKVNGLNGLELDCTLKHWLTCRFIIVNMKDMFDLLNMVWIMLLYCFTCPWVFGQTYSYSRSCGYWRPRARSVGSSAKRLPKIILQSWRRSWAPFKAEGGNVFRLFYETLFVLLVTSN